MRKEDYYALFLCFFVIMGLLIYFVPYGIYIKTTQGCFPWARDNVTINYNLSKYNYTCDDLRDIILLEVYPNLNKTINSYYCKNNFIKEDSEEFQSYEFLGIFKENCLGKVKKDDKA